ncbi:hypothetical protein [Bacillus sp. Marseille-P3661]|uniref:hypothetical protein n=1 Tax=Bacillus sp. Marseille-P3661 TaxID=1936234 RepID=UPI000C839AEA|nr:hypothetical protein [Bacillus sp. Marseille-P3661]
MYICPLCNQLDQKLVECPTCKNHMEDQGRLMDYFDDYSAYLEIDGTKLVDGFPNDQQDHECPHVFYCYQCKNEHIFLISEQSF